MIFDSQQDLIIALSVSLVAAVLLAALGFFLFLRTAGALREANDEVERASVDVDRTERRLVNILNAIPVALVETDTTGRFVFANRAAHQLLGRKDAELIGLRFHSATWGITYPDGRQIPPELLPAARALRGQTVKGFQHLMVNPGTRKRMLVSVTAMPILNSAGEVIGSTAALVETEGLATPHTAREDEELARRYFDLAGSALIALDGEGRVRDINAAGAALIGLPAAEIVGQDWFDRFVPDEDSKIARHAFQDVAQGRTQLPERSESWILRPDGARRLVAWRGGVVRDGQGAFVAALWTARDITEERTAGDQGAQAMQGLEQRLARAEAALQESEVSREKTEHALAQAQRLETAGRLSGGAAQDFDRLLAVVGGALEALLAQAESPERVRRLGQAALAANRKGEQLSRQLLALTQPRAEDLRRADLSVLVFGMQPALSREAGRAPLQFSLPDSLGVVAVDADQFEAALRNLVANARDAVSAGGAITVGAEPVSLGEGEVHPLAPGDYLRVWVADTGIGMNAETAARAPEAFFTTKPPALHAGLGLGQVYGFARHAGGAARLETRAGEGTTVSLYLPYAAAPAAEASEASSPAEAPGAAEVIPEATAAEVLPSDEAAADAANKETKVEEAAAGESATDAADPAASNASAAPEAVSAEPPDPAAMAPGQGAPEGVDDGFSMPAPEALSAGEPEPAAIETAGADAPTPEPSDEAPAKS